MILNGCAKIANLAEHFQTRPSLLKRSAESGAWLPARRPAGQDAEPESSAAVTDTGSQLPPTTQQEAAVIMEGGERDRLVKILPNNVSGQAFAAACSDLHAPK